MDIDQLVREFQFAGLSRRRQLAQAAVRDATEADLIRIIHLLVHPSELVRLGAIEILEVAQFRPALPVLVDVTKKRQNDERIFAARAIAAMASPGDIDTLEAVAQSWLRSDDPYLPLHGQIALQRMGLAAPPIPTRAKPRQSSTAAAIRDLAELLEDIEQMSQEQDNIATGDNNGSPGGKRSSDRSGDDDEYSTLDAIDPDSDDSDEFPFDEKTPLWVEDPTEEKLRAELEKLPLSSEAREVVWPELERMAFLTREHPEYEKNHRFLKLVTKLPWGKRVQPVPLSPAVAAERMDATHTGLAEAKRTILKYLAVETLRETPCPRVLCFVGPPGVGKTSLAKSIADVLQRPFCQLSMGGVDDEVAIRGFERTYLFSSPGRLIRSIIRAGVMNPLLLLDEIDKLGQRWSDPAAALLEVLDPECNKQFTDSYLQFPFDLSEVFVICTANVAANIDPILRDRMEIVEMTGYTRDEKLELASTHVVPHAVVEAGLDRTAVQFDSEAIEELIDHYTQEAGVRELSRSIATVCRGVALDTVTSGPSAQPRVIRRQDIRLHLGKPRAYIDRAAETLPPGVATGLTWTQVGGGLMPIECARLPHGDGTLHFTGKIGDILEESARLAISHVRSRTDTFAVSAQFLDHSDLHFHFPDGATPKQGPSAGLAIALALVSLLRDQPTRADTGMTGEITLTGQLRPVGGIKAKLLGAAAGGLKRVILPAANRTDVECDLPDITGDLELIYVSTIAEAIPAALIAPDTPEE